MSRNRFADFLQDHRFWLVDISPSGAFPFLVLGAPFLGFKSITSPEYTFEVEKIKQLNSMFKTPVYAGGEVSTITLTRGCRGFDNSMWEWTYRAMKGYDVPYRNLLLIQYSNIGAGANGDYAEGVIPSTAWEAGMFLPARAWILWHCIPGRYKSASDFDASSGQVSISEMDIEVSGMSEFTLFNPV